MWGMKLGARDTKIKEIYSCSEDYEMKDNMKQTIKHGMCHVHQSQECLWSTYCILDLCWVPGESSLSPGQWPESSSSYHSHCPIMKLIMGSLSSALV